MASTRNKNTPEDYCLEQRSLTQSRDYKLYEYGSNGRAYHTAIPCLGVTPSHMPRNTLSDNPVDIESALFGINSTNLVEPQKPVVPQLKTVPEVAYFERMALILPEEFVPLKNQRPFPIPNAQ